MIQTSLDNLGLGCNVAGQPVQAFIQSLTRCSTSALNVPAAKIQ
uniref:Uncharacterized protein n=1 Tax=Zea mays TaxID=4577 RepID=C4J0X2_MAIZE|nr:unknown [Zea mays]